MPHIIPVALSRKSPEEAARLRLYMTGLDLDEAGLAAQWDVPIETVEDVLAGRARLVRRDEQVLDQVTDQEAIAALRPAVDLQEGLSGETKPCSLKQPRIESSIRWGLSAEADEVGCLPIGVAYPLWLLTGIAVWVGIAGTILAFV